MQNFKMAIKFNIYADMAELADALASGASWGNSVQVRFLLSAPKSTRLVKVLSILFITNSVLIACIGKVP